MMKYTTKEFIIPYPFIHSTTLNDQNVMDWVKASSCLANQKFYGLTSFTMYSPSYFGVHLICFSLLRGYFDFSKYQISNIQKHANYFFVVKTLHLLFIHFRLKLSNDCSFFQKIQINGS